VGPIGCRTLCECDNCPVLDAGPNECRIWCKSHNVPVLDTGPNGCHGHWRIIHHCCTRVPMGAVEIRSDCVSNHIVISSLQTRVPMGTALFAGAVNIRTTAAGPNGCRVCCRCCHRRGSQWGLHFLQVHTRIPMNAPLCTGWYFQLGAAQSASMGTLLTGSHRVPQPQALLSTGVLLHHQSRVTIALYSNRRHK
jgi:hypothetical protein